MSDYQRIEKAIRFLDAHFTEQPSLEAAARAARLSPFHFQRLFTRWAGVSPKQFVGYLTAQYAKKRLRESRSVLDAALDSGLSGPGRMHDLLVKVEAMTPGEVKALGAGLVITYGVHASPFGDCLVAITPRGLCGLSFLGPELSARAAVAELKARWPGAAFRQSAAATRATASAVFAGRELSVVLKGSKFQLRIWEALLRVPPGELVSYQRLAREVGAPRASRAAGSAVAANPIGFLIPCHRVIRETGVVGQYRWGTVRKKALIAWEGARHPSCSS